MGGHEDIVWDVQWHPLGHILATCGNDCLTRFWTRNRPGDDMADKYNVNQLPDDLRHDVLIDLAQSARHSQQRHYRLPKALEELDIIVNDDELEETFDEEGMKELIGRIPGLDTGVQNVGTPAPTQPAPTRAPVDDGRDRRSRSSRRSRSWSRDRRGRSSRDRSRGRSRRRSRSRSPQRGRDRSGREAGRDREYLRSSRSYRDGSWYGNHREHSPDRYRAKSSFPPPPPPPAGAPYHHGSPGHIPPPHAIKQEHQSFPSRGHRTLGRRQEDSRF